MSKTVFTTILLLFQCSFLLNIVNSGTPEGESCYSYAGGTVYPQDNRDPTKTQHKLQWTKAMSKYRFIVKFIL